jgi:queuine/archaeosine tRNA-ribosyltransferase
VAEIVILYRSDDLDKVKRIAEWLDKTPWSFWWDHNHASGAWSGEVEKQIKAAKCVLPIWTTAAIHEDSQVRNEVHFAQQIKRPRIHVRLESVPLPVHVSTETYTDIDLSDPDPGFDTLYDRLRLILAAKQETFGTMQNVRPPSVIIRDKEYPLPAFVRSVSSYETPLAAPGDALLAIDLHPSKAPVLISAFDLSWDGGMQWGAAAHLHQEITTLDAQGCILFLDSGNYEAYRLKRGQKQKVLQGATKWGPEHFYSVVKKKKKFDFVFCFDDPMASADTEKLSESVISACRNFSLSRSCVIPIVHAPLEGPGIRDLEALLTAIKLIVKELDCNAIAVPERELSDGILCRSKNVRRIRQVLNETGRYRLLHILGTGNPYSILLLAAAGADLFDGLEWCRTVADPETGRLHHAHHFDLFQSHMKFSNYDTVRDVLSDDDMPFSIKLLVHNLDFFDRWMEEVRERVAAGDAIGMFSDYLSTHSSADSLQAIEQVLTEEV